MPITVNAVGTVPSRVPPKPTPPISTDEIPSGFKFVFGQAYFAALGPCIHPFNAFAAISAKSGVSSVRAVRISYAGPGDLPPNTIRNFWSGIGPHWLKEFMRGCFKVPAIQFVKPWLETHMPNHSSTLFAGFMSSCEVAVNGFDVLKSCKANGIPFTRALSGSGLNGARQFYTWYSWMAFADTIDSGLQGFGIDTKTPHGFVLFAHLQSWTFTPVVYPGELVLRSFQVKPDLYPYKGPVASIKTGVRILLGQAPLSSSNMIKALTQQLKGSGVRGLYPGFIAKLLGNTILAGGSTALHDATALTYQKVSARSVID